MRVEFEGEDGRVEAQVLKFDALAELSGSGEPTSRWRIADVRANRAGGKGRGLTRKQREAVVVVPLAALRRINLHIDI